MCTFDGKIFVNLKNCLILQHQNKNGAIAQSVEQRTENPCVPGSIPGGTTKKGDFAEKSSLLFTLDFYCIFSVKIVILHSEINDGKLQSEIKTVF